MLLILAEISDKMPTVGQMWLMSLSLSSPFAIGIMRKWLSGVALVVSIAVSGFLAWSAYCQAFVEPGFSDAVQREMGRWWIVNSITSAFLPVAVALVVFCWHVAKRRKDGSAKGSLISTSARGV